MPVEAQKIKDRLKALFPKANLSAKRLDELSERLAKKPADDADQNAIDEVINAANDFIPFEDIAKEDDRVRTLETKAKAAEGKQDPPKNDPPKQDDPPKTDDDTPAWAKKQAEMMEKLSKELEEIKTGKITETKLQQAKKLFDSSEILKSIKDEESKEFFFKQVDPNSETPFEEQIKALETRYSALVQQQADSTDYSGAPANGGASGKPSEKELDDIIANAGR